MSASAHDGAVNPQGDGPPSAKRQRTSTDTYFAPSRPLLSHMEPGPAQAFSSGWKPITSDLPGWRRPSISDDAPSLPAGGPATASRLEQPPPNSEPPKEVATDRAPVKFKMKKTGTNGLPPGDSVPIPLTPQPASSSTSPSFPGIAYFLDSQETRPHSQDSTLSEVTTPSRPSSAAGPKAQMTKTATPQSIAMKEKWASGKMDRVGETLKRKWAAGEMDAAAQKAAQTRRLNAERRKSGISISDSSTPEPAVASSTPVPTPDKRPTILPPKKKLAREYANIASHHVSVTPFARSLSGRPYNMVPNESGRLVHGFGALFPDGYVPLPDPVSKHPRWICPVTGCTHERSYLKSHAKLFMYEHRACQLNDNGDGTFKVVGHDAKQSVPTVVSRVPVGPTGAATSDIEGSAAPDIKADAVGHLERGQVNAFDRPFLYTPSGRPYTTYPDHGGRTGGVIIPDGYERLKASADPEKPHVCPVASCLVGCKTLPGLPIHFSRLHRGYTFNDNLDGTITLLGRRDDDARFQVVPGWDRNTALVVRQSHMDTSDQRRTVLEAHDQVRERKSASDATPTPTPNPPAAASSIVQTPYPKPKHYLTAPDETQPAQKLDGGALEIWNYIRPHLTQFRECPDSSWIPELLQLRKVRDIVWNDDYVSKYGFVDKVSREIATMIIQVTGEAAEKPCSCCRDRKGPYLGCIMIPPEAPIEARLKFFSCASCIYNGQGTYCTLKFMAKRRAEEAAAELESLSTTQRVEADPEQSIMSDAQVAASAEAQSLVRRSERVLVKEAVLQTMSTETPLSKDGGTGHEDVYMPDEGGTVPRPSPPRRALRGSHARRSEEQKQTELNATPTQYLQIEDWELAPGHLQSKAPQEDDTTPAEEIFFSQAYLSADRSVRVHRDAAFRMHVVGSGASLRWAAAPETLRICSVAAGKVKIRIQGEDEVDLGPHGMFRLLPGKSCVVFNRFYGDAVVHVTELSDYS